MPKKKGEFDDLTYEGLLKLFYGEKGDGTDSDAAKLRRYENTLQVNITSPQQETEVKNLFSKIGTLTKIAENDDKTYDYLIEDKKMLLEVTSINCISTPDSNKIDTYTKVREAVKHITEKDASKYPNHIKGGIIYYDTIFWFFGHMADYLTPNLPKGFNIEDEEWDYLIFHPPPISQVRKIVAYVKRPELCDLLLQVFEQKEYECHILPK